MIIILKLEKFFALYDFEKFLSIFRQKQYQFRESAVFGIYFLDFDIKHPVSIN